MHVEPTEGSKGITRLRMVRYYVYKLWFCVKCLLVKDDVIVNGWFSGEDVKNTQEHIIEVLKPKHDDIILEYGCGTGMHLNRLSKHCEKIVGLDHIRCTVNRAQKINAEAKGEYAIKVR